MPTSFWVRPLRPPNDFRELDALDRCVHPNIVALLAREKTRHGYPALVQELLKCTLEEHFERHKGFFTGTAYKAPPRFDCIDMLLAPSDFIRLL